MPTENRKRKVSEFARTYGSKARVAWVRALPSVVSGKGPCVNAHVRGDGAGRKADYCWIVPLTRDEHDGLHFVGVRAFEHGYSVDLKELAAETQRAWEQHCSEKEA